MLKFSVKVTPEESEILQEALFKAGYKWCDETEKVFIDKFNPYPYIGVDSNKTFYHSKIELEKQVSLKEALIMLTTHVCVDVSNKFISEAVQKAAIEKGYSWPGTGKNVNFIPSEIYFRADLKRMFGNSGGLAYKTLSIEEFIDWLESHNTYNIEIEGILFYVDVSNKTVIANDNTASFDELKKVYEAIYNEEPWFASERINGFDVTCDIEIKLIKAGCVHLTPKGFDELLKACKIL